jgi:hypothetical protein
LNRKNASKPCLDVVIESRDSAKVRTISRQLNSCYIEAIAGIQDKKEPANKTKFLHKKKKN